MKTKPAKRMAAAIAVMAALALAACSDSGTADIEASALNSAKAAMERMDGVIGGEVAAFTLLDQPKPLPEFTFVTQSGETVSTADFKGKAVLLNLWATWCAPCRHEMPALDQLEAEMGGDNFAVVPVSIDRGDNLKPLAFYEETGLQHLPFYHDASIEIFNGMKKEGFAFGLPATVLIDSNGLVLGQLNGPADWASDDAKAMVRAALGE